MTVSTREEVRAEQLRLVLGGIAQSVVTGVSVATLMLAVLWPLASHAILLCWYGAFLVVRLPAAAFAYRALRAEREASRDRREYRILFGSKIVEGLLYGALRASHARLENRSKQSTDLTSRISPKPA